MSTRGSSRRSAAMVAGLAVLGLAFGLAQGPHRAGALLRGLPRTAVTVGHAADLHGLPVGHRVGKVAGFTPANDAARAPACLSVVVAALVVTGTQRRRRQLIPVRASRSRAPPTRH